MSLLRQVLSWTFDGYGNPIKSTNEALAVYDANVYNVPFNEFFHEHTGISTTLAVQATSGDTSITVVDATLIVVGDSVQISNGTIEPTFPIVTNKVGNVLTLDRPLDFTYAIGGSVEVVNFEMSVVGTLASPKVFRLIPDSNQVWNVNSLTISMIHNSTGDDSLFGNLIALTNGITFRGYNGLASQHRTNSNWKSNGDFALDFGDLSYTDKAGGGNHGTKAQVSLKTRSGAVSLLNGANGDYLEVLVQDDISALGSIRIKSQGHIIF